MYELRIIPSNIDCQSVICVEPVRLTILTLLVAIIHQYLQLRCLPWGLIIRLQKFATIRTEACCLILHSYFVVSIKLSKGVISLLLGSKCSQTCWIKINFHYLLFEMSHCQKTWLKLITSPKHHKTWNLLSMSLEMVHHRHILFPPYYPILWLFSF